MIDSVRGGSDFLRLRRTGQREHATYLWCNWCREPGLRHAKASFAITRAYGSAVRRNRLRRRIRHVLNDLDRTQQLPPVVLLFGTSKRPPTQQSGTTTPKGRAEQTFEPTFRQVHSDVHQIVGQIRQALAIGQR